MTETEVVIDRRVIGPGAMVFVVAEIGINHGGNLEQAHRMIDAAADAGADAVKFQTFRADRMMLPVRERLAQQEAGSESAYEMFRRMELGCEAHEQLKKHADGRGVVFLSTPFDEESADLLERIGVPAFKVASSDITHTPLLRHIAAKKKPVLLSTGMSFLNEVADALLTLKSAGARDVLLLHCTSCYPAEPEQLNLRAIETLRGHFGLPVGYSDHSLGIIASLMAVAIGAVLLEKHFTLDKQANGPDHKLSMDPAELRSLIQHLREVEASLGSGRKRPVPGERENRRLSRRSIVTLVDIRAFEPIEPWMLAFKRPGDGIEPKYFESVVGMCARHNISRDKILQWEDLVPALSALSSEQDMSVPIENGSSASTRMPERGAHA